MKLIKLTSDYNKIPVWVNPEFVQMIRPEKENDRGTTGKTWISLVGESDAAYSATVTEHPVEVVRQLLDA